MSVGSSDPTDKVNVWQKAYTIITLSYSYKNRWLITPFMTKWTEKNLF